MIQARVTVALFLSFVCGTAWLAAIPAPVVVLCWLIGLWGVTQRVAWIPNHAGTYVVGGCLSLLGGRVIFQALAFSNDDAPYWKIGLVTLGCICWGWQIVSLFRQQGAIEHALSWGMGSLFGFFANFTALHPAMQVLWAVCATATFVLAVEANHSHAEYLRFQSWRLRLTLWTTTISAVLLLLWPVEEYFVKVLSLTQNWMQDSINAAAGSERGARMYLQHATLDSVAFEKRTESQNLALRVHANFLPGYMRGMVFDTFHGKRWTQGSSRRSIDMHTTRIIKSQPHSAYEKIFPKDLFETDDRPYFALDPQSAGPWYTMEITNQPRRGAVYFTPLGCEYLQANASSLWYDQHGIVRRGPDVNKPYRAILNHQAIHATLTPELAGRLTAIPAVVAPGVIPLAKQIGATANTTREKITAVENYFRSQYQYSLDGFTVPEGEDQLTYFLTHKPPAHCEFFASATAMLLRAQDVPTRYVTGYLVATASEGSDSEWTALNRDAHSWTEAYDRETNRWVIVEATPGVKIPKTLAESLLAAQQAGGASEAARELVQQDEDIRTTFFFRFSPQLAMRIFSWLAVATLVAWLVYTLWSLARRRTIRSTFSAERLQLQRLLARVDRKLSTQRVTRLHHETLQQFAQRLRSMTERSEWFATVAQWYEAYAQAVYGRELNARDVQELQQQAP
jgi:protein-glutamine gamma-glutamyltransferase